MGFIITVIIISGVLGWVFKLYQEQKIKCLKEQVDAEVARIREQGIRVRPVSEQEFMWVRQRYIENGQLDQRDIETLATNELQGELRTRQQALAHPKAVFSTISLVNWANKELAAQGHKPINLDPEVEEAGRRHASVLGKQRSLSSKMSYVTKPLAYHGRWYPGSKPTRTTRSLNALWPRCSRSIKAT